MRSVPRHPFDPPRGRLAHLSIDSKVLGDNLVGDPSEREVAVYLPPGYDVHDRQYPMFVYLAAFTSSGLKEVGWRSFEESLPQRVDRLTDAGEMGEVILVMPDCFTSLGGNQYVDSVAMGRWEHYLVHELVPAVEAEFRVLPGRECRALFGHSSGGYGALVHGMRHADAWGAVASHAGDVGFELLYRRDLARALDALAPFDGEPEAFLEHLESAAKIQGNDFYAMMMLAMAATYDPDPEAPRGIRLPCDPHTGALIPERWHRWLDHDPLRLVEAHGAIEQLQSLRGLWIDVGSRDEYLLHYGTRQLVRKLEAAGVTHHHEEFPDGHSKIAYRYDRSLPFLYQALACAG